MQEKVYPDGILEDSVLCEYETSGGQKCAKKALFGVKGRALCSTHKRYGETMEPKKGYLSAQQAANREEDALDGDPPAEHEVPDTAAETIADENAQSEFRSAQQQPQSGKAFKLATLYKELGDMEQDIILHADMFDNAPAIAHKVNGVKMAVLKEMGSAPPPDPNQMTLPVGPKVTETASGK